MTLKTIVKWLIMMGKFPHQENPKWKKITEVKYCTKWSQQEEKNKSRFFQPPPILPSTGQENLTKKDKLYPFSSNFSLFLTISVLFCSLMKGITMTICRLCVCVIINKRSFESFLCLDVVTTV